MSIKALIKNFRGLSLDSNKANSNYKKKEEKNGWHCCGTLHCFLCEKKAPINSKENGEKGHCG